MKNMMMMVRCQNVPLKNPKLNIEISIMLPSNVLVFLHFIIGFVLVECYFHDTINSLTCHFKDVDDLIYLYQQPTMNRVLIKEIVLRLTNEDRRESALLGLSKKRDVFSDLEHMIWYSYGTVAITLQ